MVISRGEAVEPDIQHELSSFIKIFSLLGAIILVLFGAINIAFEANYFLGYSEFIGGIAMAFNFMLLHFTKNVIIARNMLLVILIVFLILMLVTGGIQGTGVFWFYTFPVTAFFVSGKVKGIAWIAALYGLALTTLVLNWAGVIKIPYSLVEVVQMLVCLFIVSFAIYIYQQTRESATRASKHNKQELQTERVRADAIVENIAEGVIALDDQGRVTFINQAAEDMLGWWQHDLLDKKFTEVVKINDENDRPMNATGWPLLKGDVEKQTSVLSYYKKDGSKALLLSNGAAIINEGSLVGYIVSFHDVAEEREIDRAKSEFMTVASHQLRTPISAISWFSEMLLNGDAGKLNEEQQNDLQQIHQSNKRMARLVGDMLIVSRLELHNLPVTPQPTDLSELLHKVIKEQTEGITEDRLPKIKEHFDEMLQKVNVDPDLTKIILQNLISNAIKYTPKDGNISIEVIGSGGRPENKITLIISDSGYGIPKNLQDKIFTKFFRADNIRDKDTDGTGLGLFIVKALLDYIGGDISFTSEENQGTIFVVHLPYIKPTKDKK
jgi:PAS domain S-box-containing protein